MIDPLEKIARDTADAWIKKKDGLVPLITKALRKAETVGMLAVLVPIYLEDSYGVAVLCDGSLDKTGALLQMVRQAARDYIEGSNDQKEL